MISMRGLIKLGFEPDIDFVLQDNSDGMGVFFSGWMSDKTQPTVPEIEAAEAEWQIEWDSQKYARNRKAEYPHLDDLLVALWEGVVEERMEAVVELEGKRQAVKTKYPKPD